MANGVSTEQADETQKAIRRRSTQRSTAKDQQAAAALAAVTATSMVAAVREAFRDLDVEALVDKKIESVLVEKVEAESGRGEEDGDRPMEERVAVLEAQVATLMQSIGGYPQPRERRTVQFEADVASRGARRPAAGLVEHRGYSYVTAGGKTVHVAPHVQRLS